MLAMTTTMTMITIIICPFAITLLATDLSSLNGEVKQDNAMMPQIGFVTRADLSGGTI